MNPNETILIPLLNRRIADIVAQNIVFEAKNILLEQEKEALLRQAQELSERIEKLEAAQKKRSKKDGTTLDGSTY
jgi:hypothetical protein